MDAWPRTPGSSTKRAPSGRASSNVDSPTAQCPDYACEKLTDRLVVYEELAARTPFSIPPEDRARFIAPYENKRRLDQLRRPS